MVTTYRSKTLGLWEYWLNTNNDTQRGSATCLPGDRIGVSSSLHAKFDCAEYPYTPRGSKNLELWKIHLYMRKDRPLRVILALPHNRQTSSTYGVLHCVCRNSWQTAETWFEILRKYNSAQGWSSRFDEESTDKTVEVFCSEKKYSSYLIRQTRLISPTVDR